MAQNIELFAPFTIAFAIGAYLNILCPPFPLCTSHIFAYLIFTGLNIYGVQAAAVAELGITVIALSTCCCLPDLLCLNSNENILNNAPPNGWGGAFAAPPFAIWFFLVHRRRWQRSEETITHKAQRADRLWLCHSHAGCPLPCSPSYFCRSGRLGNYCIPFAGSRSVRLSTAATPWRILLGKTISCIMRGSFYLPLRARSLLSRHYPRCRARHFEFGRVGCPRHVG